MENYSYRDKQDEFDKTKKIKDERNDGAIFKIILKIKIYEEDFNTSINIV